MCGGNRLGYRVVYTKQAVKDAKKIKSSGLKDKVIELIELIKENPFEKPPNFEKLVGDLKGAYSRRINIQHRLVYQVIEDEKIIKILRMWSHYD